MGHVPIPSMLTIVGRSSINSIVIFTLSSKVLVFLLYCNYLLYKIIFYLKPRLIHFLTLLHIFNYNFIIIITIKFTRRDTISQIIKLVPGQQKDLLYIYFAICILSSVPARINLDKQCSFYIGTFGYISTLFFFNLF